MASIDSEHLPAPMSAPSEEFEHQPSLTEPDLVPLKQQSKKKLLTPLNIFIILASLALLGLGSYYLYSLSSGNDAKNQINETHDKIISYADSSSDKGGSNSGSTSSKSSSNNNKPNAKSQPASKGVITSNSKLTGSAPGTPGDGDDEDEDGNSEKKGKSGSGGSSTEVDSNEEESEEEASDENDNNEPIVWVDTKAPGAQMGASPNVGSARSP